MEFVRLLPGATCCPPWLETHPIPSNSKTTPPGESMRDTKNVDKPIWQGTESAVVDQALTGLAIGSQEFVAKVLCLGKRRFAQRRAAACAAEQGRMGTDETSGQRSQRRVVGIIC